MGKKTKKKRLAFKNQGAINLYGLTEQVRLISTFVLEGLPKPRK
jgi:hypothetical protein